jgi:hypothetical protein
MKMLLICTIVGVLIILLCCAWCGIRTCKGPGSPTDRFYEEGS